MYWNNQLEGLLTENTSLFLESYYKAHIPPETAFMLADQREETGDEQHEVDMPNESPTFHQLALGHQLGWFRLVLGWLGLSLG